MTTKPAAPDTPDTPRTSDHLSEMLKAGASNDERLVAAYEMLRQLERDLATANEKLARLRELAKAALDINRDVKQTNADFKALRVELEKNDG